MSNLTEFPDLGAVREQAALWIARIDRELTDSEQAEFRQWVRRPAERRAFQELGGVWEGMDVLSVLAEVFPRPAPQVQPVRRAFPWALGGVAASVLMAATLLMLPDRTTKLPQVDAAASAPRVEAFATAIGENRSITLRDGSLLTLNTNSLVEVTISNQVRQLHLRRGEAHFEVAHDTTRPFTVSTGAHAVVAVGTAFNIRLKAAGAVDVLVTSGKVRFTGSGQPTPSEPLVAAGQLLELKSAGTQRVRPLDAAAVESRLAWRRGVLIFEGETLASALDEVSRYMSTRIELADPALGARRIAGYFPTSDLNALFGSLRNYYGIVVTETATGFRLSEAGPGPTPD
jgi:transmembrane sensor